MSVPALGTILCAVDASDHATAVAYAGAGLAHHPDSRLVVLRVDPRAGRGEGPALAAQSALNELVLAAVPGSLGYAGRTEILVRAGSAARVIVATARECGASLIVMGSRGRGRLGRALFGSTSARVLERSPIPVAVVPPTDPEIVSVYGVGGVPRFGLIVVPVDLRSDPQAQVQYASLLVQGSSHRLALLHVLGRGRSEEAALARLQTLARSLGGRRRVRILLQKGDPAAAIARVVDHDDVGLVVLGRDGRAPGSVAAALLRRATAVVLLVP